MTERLVKEKIKNYKIHRSLTPSLLHRTVSPVRSTTISLITLNNTPLSFDRSSDHIRLINYHRTPACVGRMCRRKLLLRVRSTNAWRRTRTRGEEGGMFNVARNVYQLSRFVIRARSWFRPEMSVTCRAHGF